MFHGCNGPVNVVEIDGTFFIENDEAEAKTARLNALELASEVAVASKAPENSAAAAAAGVAMAPALMSKPAAALDSEPAYSVGTSSARATHRNSYAAAAAKPPVRPKPSAAGIGPRMRSIAASKFSAGPKCSTPAFQPAVVPAPPEVIICMMSIQVHTCRCMQVQRVQAYTCQAVVCWRANMTFDTTPEQEVDDFAVAQNTPLPECVAGSEGDKVCSQPYTAELRCDLSLA